jgi:hypothetical protein
MSVDPETRDVVQNIYLCRVEKIDGELYNSEFVTFQASKNPIEETKRVAKPTVDDGRLRNAPFGATRLRCARRAYFST